MRKAAKKALRLKEKAKRARQAKAIKERRKSHLNKRSFIEVAVRIKPSPPSSVTGPRSTQHSSRRRGSRTYDGEPDDESIAVKVKVPNTITLTSFVENPDVLAQGEDPK